MEATQHTGYDAAYDIEDTEPTMLAAPEMAETSQEKAREALRQGPVIVGDWWSMDFTPDVPKVLPFSNGDGEEGLFYAAKINAIVGEPGRGKSMLAQFACLAEARAGRTALFIDLEKDLSHFVERMRALGATREDAQRIGYWRLHNAFTDETLRRIRSFADSHVVGLVVIDSVGRAVSRAGLDENNNNDVRTWYDQVPEQVVRWGCTALLVDHTTKPQKGFSSRYQKGAGAKLDAITGVSVLLEFASSFSRDKEGFAKAIVAKDNNGWYAEGTTVAEVRVSPEENGKVIHLAVTKPSAAASEAGEEKSFRPTVLMERMTEWLAKMGQPVSWTSAREAPIGVRGGKANKTALDAALVLLRDEGYISWPKGKPIELIKTYSQANDPLSERYAGAAASEEGNEWF
jgi:KaiC/GvpD/RAD55 family RecA-like ATPase